MSTPHCKSCGMPMEKPADFGNGNLKTKTCVYCTKPDGSLKPCAEIFEGGVQFFMNATGSSRDLAERLTRKNMLAQHAWNGKNEACLAGTLASDEEFQEAMGKL
ncbi:MAG: zinc ribbon domain-containing protein [bacterium]